MKRQAPAAATLGTTICPQSPLASQRLASVSPSTPRRHAGGGNIPVILSDFSRGSRLVEADPLPRARAALVVNDDEQVIARWGEVGIWRHQGGDTLRPAHHDGQLHIELTGIESMRTCAGSHERQTIEC